MPIPDQIEDFHGARIQHGPYNRRIYLMNLGTADPEHLPAQLANFAKQRGYGKVFAKVPARVTPRFLAADYRREAGIPGFFSGREDADLLGLYLEPSRAEEHREDLLRNVLESAREKAQTASQPTPEPAPSSTPDLPPETALCACNEADVTAMARIYGEVFPSSPFPIDTPEYLLDTMRTHVDYFGVRNRNGDLVALASAEMDPENSNVEMTDFATLSDARGHGFAVHLLRRMENAMTQRGMHTAYTIARAVSYGMNITFARCGYAYGGTLTNNTNISGTIESMNIWHKPLR